MDLSLITDGRKYIETFLKIQTKEGKLEEFKLNKAQLRLYEALRKQDEAGKPMRAIVLKARQMGFSTLTEAVIFHETATRSHKNALIVAHQDDSTRNLFGMSKRYLENLPGPLKPMTRSSNAQEIVFENPDKNRERAAINPGLQSKIRCQTAGGRAIGRSDTLQYVHASEFAFWPGDKIATWTGIMQAVPAERGTLVIIESTANGYDEFHKLWQQAEAGESDFVPMFFPWYEHDAYRMKPEPGFERTSEERELAERFRLDDEQLAWRRWCIKNNCSGDIDMFRQEYPSFPEEAFLTSGTPVFDMDKVNARLISAPEPVAVGQFSYDSDPDNPARIWNIHWEERENGCIKIYRKPEEGKPYVVGGDTAGTGSDFFVGQVLDNTSGCQVAVLRHRYDEDQYTAQMFCLGQYYNDALLGVEVNYSTYPVKLLEHMRYPKQYIREVMDTFTGAVKKAFGWETTSRTRPVAIAELVQAFREQPELVADKDTLREMLVFNYNDNHRPEALPGEHDDLVMALAIANAIRGQQEMTLPPQLRETRNWTADMWDDYARADQRTKDYLLKKWGAPKGS